MNINEVLYLPVKREGLSIGPDEFDCKHRYSTLDGEEVVTSFKAKTKEELLDQQKPEIPQFVADWIETVKSLGFDLYELLEGPADNSLEEWITNEDNQELIVKARLFGYTVEKEKLYTVEIPNPNDKQIALRLEKWVDEKVIIIATHSSNNFTNDMLLTEKEIRKDFEWAWKWAEEVTE
ncbi:TPA: DUF1642 domain-containing protein [Streptococcus equi subsp. zooepidemicus]|nr:DUF1642 domain-containing protein [Streptococcus equi subsp. zooepidemicus]HEL0808227.1 DUF1642 domain-containing protein [Streptococcus equi subsp. zooepidemicus]